MPDDTGGDTADWTDEEWEGMTAWERLTRLPQELDRRSGRLDGDELTSAGEGSTITVDTGGVLGTVPLTDATGADIDADPTATADVGGLTFTQYHTENREEAADAAGSALDALLDMVPTWVWVLGGLVLAGAAFGYTRPLWEIAANRSG
ncbi:hypothetical protein EXE53_15375 [Halorubrum sp. SD626R]|uniref:hypothetical protein n=1 Tax=Halorubrum sp. SD626R TaxID=1419722 RepID=UPI0010F81133|nr:hypothetical protein [Halorubrum sp. SD626R]TKX79543.1 hypothetical protein EXE53_15375 [Halorubrum sp. SD626R]